MTCNLAFAYRPCDLPAVEGDDACYRCPQYSRPVTLLSTVVAPAFRSGTLTLTPVQINADLLRQVTANFCGHPVTDSVLRAIERWLPAPVRGFWDGTGLGLAIRPRGGIRGAQASGDTEVGLDDLEAVLVEWTPS